MPNRRTMRIVLAVVAVAIGVAPIIIYMLPSRPAPVVVPRDAVPPQSAIARAHAAESAGDLALAIEQYERAYDDSKEPSYLYRLGELAERAGRPADAARFFQRYLDAVPSATDREAVKARIARLGEVGSNR